MVQLILPSILLLLLILVSFYRLIKMPNIGNIIMFLSIILTGMVVAVDINSMYFDRLDLTDYKHHLEPLVALSWYLSTLLYCNNSSISEYKKRHFLILIFSSLLVLWFITNNSLKLFISPDFQNEHVLFLTNNGMFYSAIILILLVLALANIEALLLSLSESELWRAKLDAVSIGIIIFALVIYYSQSLMFKLIDLRWIWIVIISIGLSVTLFIVNLYRNKGLNNISISRQIAFRSFVLIASGAYLVVFGLAGEAFKYLGFPFRNLVLGGLGLTSSLIFILILFSGSLRRKIKVYLHKNFYKQKYDYRIQWNEFSLKLSKATDKSELFEIISKSYLDLFGFSSIAIFTLDAELMEYIPVYVVGIDNVHQLKIKFDGYLVTLLREKEWVVNTFDEIIPVNNEVTLLHDSGVRLIVPMLSPDKLEGLILLSNPLNRTEKYIYEDFDLMKTIARQALVSLINFNFAEQIIRLRENEAIGSISTFVIHDLKNYISSISLLLQNAEEFIILPEFQTDMIASLKNTLSKMNAMIARLKNLGEKELLNISMIDLYDLAESTIKMFPNSQIQLIGRNVEIMIDKDEIQKVIINLLLNSIEASPAESPVSIETGDFPKPFIKVSDNGVGMSKEFQSRELFKPFSTTKKNGLGIGLFQCRKIVEAHGGTIEIKSDAGIGTSITVYFPKSVCLSGG